MAHDNKSKKIKKHITGFILSIITKYPKTLDYGLKIMIVTLDIISFIGSIATISDNQKGIDDIDTDNGTKEHK
jgi:hypothetical protein